jgi:hypothetical protein
MDSEERKPWLRRPNETSVAYEAFRIYLNLGPQRTLPKVCEEVSKSRQLITLWSSKHDWVERVRSFDVHLAEASTDGMVHQLTQSRDKNLALMDKLRGLLNDRLDIFIEKKMDPTVAWTKAVEAMARVEANSITAAASTNGKVSESVDRVARLIERLEAAGAPVSARGTDE